MSWQERATLAEMGPLVKGLGPLGRRKPRGDETADKI